MHRRRQDTARDRNTLRQIGSHIREIRVSRGLMSKQLAQSINVSQQYMSRIESGSAIRISYLMLKKVARALRMEIADLERGRAREVSNVTTGDVLFSRLVLQIERLSESERPSVLIAMSALIDKYHEFVNATTVNPQQLALPFPGEKREAHQPRWFSARVSRTELPS
ncbi:MAG: helix-turn-helix domain-containing protein [Ignavibacteriae bacterium]|nr:helix-turn-helix domain-containing protein [Ignavibacteriota bacterium]